jgi:hypothetical protein
LIKNNEKGELHMENENKVESNVEVVDTKSQKHKQNILGKIIGWLIVLAIFGGLGYLIYQNGGIPEDGFDIGEIIGTETPEELQEFIPESIEIENNEPNAFDFSVTNKLFSIDSAALQTLPISYSLYYHRDWDWENPDQDWVEHMVKTMIGLDDFSNVVGISANHNASGYDGAYVCILVEFEDGVDTTVIAEQAMGQADPSKWNFGNEEYDVFYDSLTKDDVFIIGKGHYIYVLLIGDELIGFGKSISPERLAQAFNNSVY